MKRNIILTFLVFIFSASTFAQHENQTYLPLTGREMNSPFPVSYIGTLSDLRPPYFEEIQDTPLPPKINAGVSDITVSKNDNELTIAGKDKDRKSWSAKLEVYYAIRFYVADLDKNGIKDLILLIPTGGNGLAPTSHFFSLTFDQTGRPVPFRADGYFEDRKGKIFDLVDLDRDGRAELLYMNFDDGYWITNFYKIQNARVQKVAGKLGSRRYPLYVRFTHKENHKPVSPKKGRNPHAPDLSNNIAKKKGRLVSYNWANTNQSEDITLNIIDRRGRKIPASPISWYSTFFAVIDTKTGRKIVSLSGKEDTMKLALDEIIAEDYSIEVFGSRKGSLFDERKSGKIDPELLWARER